MECDGIIIASSEAYEKVSLEALRSWYSELNKPLYAVGPLLPKNFGGVEALTGQRNAEIETFLESMLTQHGERSVVFVRFVGLYSSTTHQVASSDVFWHYNLAYSSGIRRRGCRSVY